MLPSPNAVLAWQTVAVPQRWRSQAQGIRQITQICFSAWYPADMGSQFFSLPQTRGGRLGANPLTALCFGSRPSEQRGWRLLCVSSGEPEPGASKAVRRRRSAGVLEATPIPHVACALRGFFFASYLGLLYFITAGSLAKSYLMLCEVLSCAWEQRGLLGQGVAQRALPLLQQPLP